MSQGKQQQPNTASALQDLKANRLFGFMLWGVMAERCQGGEVVSDAARYAGAGAVRAGSQP